MSKIVIPKIPKRVRFNLSSKSLSKDKNENVRRQTPYHIVGGVNKTRGNKTAVRKTQKKHR